MSRFPIELRVFISSEVRMSINATGGNIRLDNLATGLFSLRLPGMLNDMNLTYYPALLRRWRDNRHERFSLIHHYLFLPRGTNSFDPLAVLKLTNGLPLVLGPAELPHRFEYEDYRLYSGRKRMVSSSEYSIFMSLPRLATPILNYAFQSTIDKCDRLVVAKSSAVSIYSQYINRSKIVVIPHGVNLPYIGNLIPPTNHSILMVGNLIERKAFNIAILAMRKVVKAIPDAKLNIVGDGPKREELLRLVKELGLDCVKILGRLPGKELSKLMSTCGVFCHTSYSESVSHVIDEAMAHGRPVICTDIPANADTVVDGLSGFIVRPGDSEQLAECIIKILHTHELAMNMGDAARRRARSFDWNSVAHQYFDLYQSVAI